MEKQGDTVESAIQSALRELNLNREDVEIKILDSGSKGILGFNKRMAKVFVQVTLSPQDYAERILYEIINCIGLQVDVISTLENNCLNIELIGKDANVFIGKHGAVLEATKYLLGAMLNRHYKLKVMLDAENYREKRKQQIEFNAKSTANKVLRYKKPIALRPMNSYERLLVHNVLSNYANLTTHSEGKDPNRYVIVDYKK